MTKTAHDRVTQGLALLRIRGGRRTLGRQAVLEVLVGATHLTAAQVRDRLTADGIEVDFSTVHRRLNALVAAGVVCAVPMRGRLTFGMADDAHHHTVCSGCGQMRQVPAEAVAPLLPEVEVNGFRVDRGGRDGGIVFYGRCGECRPHHT